MSGAGWPGIRFSRREESRRMEARVRRWPMECNLCFVRLISKFYFHFEAVFKYLESRFLTGQMTAAAEYLQLQYLARGIAALVIF